MWKAPRRVLTAVAVLTAIGCGGGDDGGNGPTGSISVTASPTSLTLDPGATGTVTVTLVRGGGFADPVNVTIEGLPTGITATAVPAQLTGQTTQVVVTVNVASTVAAGSYTATVRASATGVGSVTTTYTVTVNALPNYALTLTPTTLTVAPGGNGQTTVNIARTSFTGAVTLSLVAPPAGITATFNPAAPTTNSSVATINVASTVANGNYNLTIMGAATGVPTAVAGLIDEAAAAGDRTVTLAVTVAPVPDFTISANPTAVNAAPGGSGNTNISIVRSNLTADVALSLVTPPAGITGTFAPATLTGGTLTSALTLNVGSGVAAGSYNVTVQGVGGGVTKTVVVAVSVATSGGGNLVWDFCNADPLPLKFWRLSGGTWAEVTPTTVGNVTRYSFTVASGSGGVAFTTTQSSAATARIYKRLGRGQWLKATEAARAARAQASINDGALTNPHPETFVYYAQSTELSGFAETCPTAPVTVAKTFNVTGMGATEAGMLGYGGASASLVSTTSAYNLNVVAGTYDWMAIFGPAPSFPDLAQNWAAYRIGRNEAAPGAAVAVARAGATAFATFPFTVTGGAGGSLYQFTQFLEGSHGDILGFGIGSLLNTTGTGTALFLATGDRLASDMNSLFLSNTEQVGANGLSQRTSIRYLGSAPPASGTFAMPAAVPAFTVTPQGTTSWTIAGSTPPDYQTATSVVSTSITGPAAVTFITATRAYLQANGQATSYSLVTPILPNALPAWLPASPLEDALVIMIGGNLTATPTAGTVLHTGVRLQSPP